ncbi:MAG TPA: FkbM family methyltransferase [Acidimicrobiales bacterium]|nr:FkbM family methyltransferase [Acidimicrobiales bacterium]
MPPAGARLLKGTRLEPLARRLWRLIGGRQVPEDRNARYNRLTLDVMRRVITPTSDCVDVGCHTGLILREIVQLAPQGTHWAFEPLPDCAAGLRAEFPSVAIHEMALGDTDGTAEFRYVPAAPENSSFMRRPYDPPVVDDYVPLTVKVGRLDDVLGPDARIDFLKVDVEGGELAVFRGAHDTLRRSHPVVAFEMGWDPENVHEVLAAAGLRISLLDAWLDGRPPLSRDEFLDESLSGRNYFFLAHPPATT